MKEKNDRRLLSTIQLNKIIPQALELPSEDILLYHYTSLDVLWKCVDGNSMYARHVRFSNDNKEYEIGKELVSSYLKDKNLNQHIQDMYFMICFCEKEDLLSQWRGYAKDGVCIGFDFSYGAIYNDSETRKKGFSRYHEFTIMNNDSYISKEKKFLENEGYKDIEERALYTIENEPSTIISGPHKVSYISYEGDENYEEKTKELRIKLDEIYDKIEEKIQKEELLCQYIPYIKHCGFEEEDEFRLIFDLHKIGEMAKCKKEGIWDKKVTFFEKTLGIKLPNIVVRFGDARDLINDCKHIIIELGFYENKYKSFMEIIKDYCKRNNLNIIKGKKGKTDLVIGAGRNQEKIMQEIEMLMDTNNIKRGGTEAKIWFQGHLPIRTIMVAPGEDMERIKDSVEFYKNRIYWLKYAQVSCSKIPYRKNL